MGRSDRNVPRHHASWQQSQTAVCSDESPEDRRRRPADFPPSIVSRIKLMLASGPCPRREFGLSVGTARNEQMGIGLRRSEYSRDLALEELISVFLLFYKLELVG
jgi:hypothetical protein